MYSYLLFKRNPLLGIITQLFWKILWFLIFGVASNWLEVFRTSPSTVITELRKFGTHIKWTPVKVAYRMFSRSPLHVKNSLYGKPLENSFAQTTDDSRLFLHKYARLSIFFLNLLRGLGYFKQIWYVLIIIISDLYGISFVS